MSFIPPHTREGYGKAIIDVKKVLDQFDDLLNADSIIFKNARCKVLFSDNFVKLFKKLISACLEKSALSTKSSTEASCGYKPKKRSVERSCSSPSLILKKFKPLPPTWIYRVFPVDFLFLLQSFVIKSRTIER